MFGVPDHRGGLEGADDLVISSGVLSPCVTHARTISYPSYGATETQARPDARRRPTNMPEETAHSALCRAARLGAQAIAMSLE